MRTKTVMLYTYEELTDEAKAQAIESARARGWYDGSDWTDEWRQTLDEASKCLDFDVRGWEVSTFAHSYVRIELRDADAAELRGVRAWKYLHAQGYADAIAKSCPWTGYCGDESFLDPLRAFLARPDTSTTLGELMQSCGDSWVSGWVADMEAQQSDEVIAENLEANGHEFLESGELE